MPCHEDPIPAECEKKEIDLLIEVVKGKISIKDVGDDFMGEYPTVRELVAKARVKYKTFNYRVQGTTFVLVSPCPKKC